MATLAACATESRVARVVDGRTVLGPYVDSGSYAAFLRGAMAEERGDTKAALAGYDEVARRGDDDPELWTRIGSLRCRANPADATADAALARALALDPAYAPAWTARAQCDLARGQPPAARVDAERATLADPRAAEPQVLLATADALQARPMEARARLVALTLVDGSTESWDALAAWARGHGDAALVAEALSHVALLAPARRAQLGLRAVELAGDGEVWAARRLAAALLDAPGDRSSGGLGPAAASSPLVARLAIDDALVAHDADRASERAARAHVGLDVVAGRALLMGDTALALRIAGPAAKADPGFAGARVVLAAGPGASALASLRSASPVAPEALVGLARILARLGRMDAATSLVERVAHDPIAPGDDALTQAVVELAAAGVLRDDELPADARIELAARRLETPAPSLIEQADARHRLFALALTRPNDPAATALAQHLAPAAAHDVLVALALVRLSLARGVALDAGVIERLVEHNPADPLVALAALDVAKKLGVQSAIAPARARLIALARTPGERAHALE